MPTANSIWIDIAGLLAILLLVAANGFFVAAEFSLVAVRRSRVTQLVAEGQRRARALKRTIDHLDANLAATQLGITISSLALGWIGEPALAHLIQPFLTNGLVSLAQVGSHAISVTIAFVVITALHIVLGELAPKSLALQRSERTALAVVRPLALFRVKAS
jgi:putative hemolysin